jgi:hypothetical protein
MTGKYISRRDFLKVAALGIGAATLGGCRPPATPTEAPAAPTTAPQATPVPTTPPEPTEVPVVEVTITTSGWPVDVKKPEDIEADPTNEAYAAAVQAWLDQNPGTKLEKVEVDIWNTEGIMAQVAGGTDCTYLFGPCVGGGWGRENAVNAFVQGMLADITPIIAKYKLEERCLPHLWKTWSVNSQVDGKYFCYPLNEYSPDAGTLIYRKDLINELGLKEPEVNWTWDEAREVLKGLTSEADGRYGAGFATWFLPYYCAQHGWDLLTETPVPAQPWHWTRDLTSDPRWVELIEQYREMLFVDKSIYSDVALGGGDEEYFKLFHAGQIAMGRFNFWSMFGRPTEPTSLSAMADREGKAYSDMFGVATLPLGDGYLLGSGVRLWGPVSFSPNQSAEVHDKAVGLVDWMFFDKGLDMTKKGIYDITPDPRAVFSAFLYMDGRTGYEGVPGTAADAWGQEIVDRWYEVGALPVEPSRDEYLPAEQNPSPSNQAIDDQLNLMVTDPSTLDIPTMLKQGEDDWKAQVEGFASSVSAEDFKAGVQKYYTALDEYLKTNYPDFYENRFKPFYEGSVLPNIG